MSAMRNTGAMLRCHFPVST